MAALKIDFTAVAPRQQVTAGEMSGLLGGNRQCNPRQIVTLALPLLQSFSQHHFRVTDNAEMQDLCKSIRENSILEPLLVRPLGNSYEIISGHRRCRAAQLIGLAEVPCIIEEMDDDTATIRVTETNRYREQFLPSEKAFAYKAAADALHRQGRRSDLYGSEPTQSMADITGESERSIRNWIRLTYLVPELLEQVDNGVTSVRAGVALSHLPEVQQQLVFTYLVASQKRVSVTQAEQLHSAGERVTLTLLEAVLGGNSQPQLTPGIKLKKPELAQISDYIPDSYRQKQAASYIIRALEHYRSYAEEQGED